MEQALESLLDIKLGLGWYLTKKIAKLSYEYYPLLYKLPITILVKIYNSGILGIIGASVFNITKSVLVFSYKTYIGLKDLRRKGSYAIESIRRARLEMDERKEKTVIKANCRRKSN